MADTEIKKPTKYIHSTKLIKEQCTIAPGKDMAFEKLETINDAFDDALSNKEFMDSIQGKNVSSINAGQDKVTGECHLLILFNNDETARCEALKDKISHNKKMAMLDGLVGMLADSLKNKKE